jgi:hypothetical protein
MLSDVILSDKSNFAFIKKPSTKEWDSMPGLPNIWIFIRLRKDIQFAALISPIAALIQSPRHSCNWVGIIKTEGFEEGVVRKLTRYLLDLEQWVRCPEDLPVGTMLVLIAKVVYEEEEVKEDGEI